MSRGRLASAVIAALALVACWLVTSPALAHRSGCHSNHSCPSDHHTYVWYDGSGKGWDCAEPGADEVGAADTTQITYDGLLYLCHAAGAAVAVPAPVAPAPVTTTVTTQPATTIPAPVTTSPATTVVTEKKAAATRLPRPEPGLVGKTVLLRQRTKTSGCTLSPDPDRRCSPGAYYSKLTKAVICAEMFRTDPIRYVPDSEKAAVEREYGMEVKKYGKTLEIDHIVSLELGGSNDIANLYPERRDVAPGYKVKDVLETKLNGLVCHGKMTLRAAQRGIASDWQALYTKVYGKPPK